MARISSARTRRRVALFVVTVGLIGVAIPVARNQSLFRRYPKRLAVVEEGVLYRSAQPTKRQVRKLVDEYGIRTLLIAREGTSRRVPDERAFGDSQGLKVIQIPIKSRQLIPDEQVQAFFEIVDDPDNHPVLVHCSAGRHRTGYLCALYRIERQGWPVEQAIEEMLSFKFSTEGQATLLEQLRRYEPGRSGTALPANTDRLGANITP